MKSNSNGTDQYRIINSETNISENYVQEGVQSIEIIQYSKPKKRHFGNCFVFLFHNSEPLLTIGPHWPFSIFLLGIIGGLGFIVTYYSTHGIYQVITVFITLFQISIYLITALKNPGIASRVISEQEELIMRKEPQFCLKCKVLKNRDLQHCQECDICILGYDHHCPWTTKCIGKGNIDVFNIFLGSTCFFFLYFIIVSVSVSQTDKGNQINQI